MKWVDVQRVVAVDWSGDRSAAGQRKKIWAGVWTVGAGTYQFAWNVFPSPTGLAATAGNEQVTLGWNAAINASGYRVKRSLTPGSGYVVAGTVRWRRHLPSWRTTGMSLPTGTFERVKVPSAAVAVLTMGEPDAGAWHCEQIGPLTIGSSAAFGT